MIEDWQGVNGEKYEETLRRHINKYRQSHHVLHSSLNRSSALLFPQRYIRFCISSSFIVGEELSGEIREERRKVWNESPEMEHMHVLNIKCSRRSTDTTTSVSRRCIKICVYKKSSWLYLLLNFCFCSMQWQFCVRVCSLHVKQECFLALFWEIPGVVCLHFGEFGEISAWTLSFIRRLST